MNISVSPHFDHDELLTFYPALHGIFPSFPLAFKPLQTDMKHNHLRIFRFNQDGDKQQKLEVKVVIEKTISTFGETLQLLTITMRE